MAPKPANPAPRGAKTIVRTPPVQKLGNQRPAKQQGTKVEKDNAK
jgi:hypothetical protein